MIVTLPDVRVPARALINGLLDARVQYVDSREFLRKLSEVHSAKIPEWYHMDRRPTINKTGEVIKSVYRRHQTKGIISRPHLEDMNLTVTIFIQLFLSK